MEVVGALPDEEMVVATPERVAFGYEIAGVGSRSLAQAIDVLLLGAVLFAVTVLDSFVVVPLTHDARLGLLLLVVLGFTIVIGYFPFCEGIWSGQTLGKRALRIRVIGERGEPVSWSQVGIRNLVRIVDFMPVFYGIGFITIFVQGGGKRLGDFAAGTVVARERARVRLKDLVASAEAGVARAAPPAPHPSSIWADRQDPAERPPEAARPASPPVSPYELALRRLSPELRRFIAAYGRRRAEIDVRRRSQLAEQVASELGALLPAEVAAYGPLAVLDGLAALMYGVAPITGRMP